MRCKWARLLLSHYIDRGLDPRRRKRVAQHLHKCPACQKEKDRLTAAVQIIRTMEDVEPPRDYVEAVRLRLENG